MLNALDSALPARRSALWARAALALAFVAAAWAVLRLLQVLALGPALPAVAPGPASVPAEAELAAAQSVAAWHLFGNAAGPIDLAALAQAAPATVLKLTLRGTLNENAPEGGVAIIADETGTDRAYRVGDTLPGQARLEGIYIGRVLLSRGGASESLTLPRADGGASTAGSAAPASTPPPLPGTAPGLQPFVAPVIAPGGPSLESYRDAIVPDVAELARQVQVLPVQENGRMVGVRLAVGRDSNLLAQAGLRPTDIVTQVNGIPLDGPQRSAELLSALKDARSVQVTVRRDGKDLQLNLGLR